MQSLWSVSLISWLLWCDFLLTKVTVCILKATNFFSFTDWIVWYYHRAVECLTYKCRDQNGTWSTGRTQVLYSCFTIFFRKIKTYRNKLTILSSTHFFNNFRDYYHWRKGFFSGISWTAVSYLAIAFENFKRTRILSVMT